MPPKKLVLSSGKMLSVSSIVGFSLNSPSGLLFSRALSFLTFMLSSDRLLGSSNSNGFLSVSLVSLLIEIRLFLIGNGDGENGYSRARLMLNGST